ncbi:hypothetical protein ACLK2H_16970 [Escherichia coli]
MQAGTKYLIGHSDAMVGTAVQRTLLAAAARERLSDGPNARRRYRLHDQPRPAYAGEYVYVSTMKAA